VDIYQHTQNTIYDDFKVQTKVVGGLLKFGGLASLGNGVTQEINGLTQDEVYATTNAIDSVSSSSTADTQNGGLVGATVSGTTTTRANQMFTLAGQTRMPLTTAIFRSDRAGNSNADNFVGDIYFYENSAITNGVPDDLDKVHLKISSGKINQTQKACAHVPGDRYLCITHLYASLGASTNGKVGIKLFERNFGKVFQLKFEGSAGDDSPIEHPYGEHPLIVPPNSDVAMVGTGTAPGMVVVAGFDGFYAMIQ